MVTRTASQTMTTQGFANDWILPADVRLPGYYRNNAMTNSSTVLPRLNKSVTSVSTPNYWKRKPVYVRWVFRKPYVLITPPKKPVLRLIPLPVVPLFTPLVPRKIPFPTRFVGKDGELKNHIRFEFLLARERAATDLRNEKRKKAFSRVLSRFNTNLARISAINAKRLSNFKLLMTKYEKKLIVSTRLERLAREGGMKMKRLRNSVQIQNNPYSSTTTLTFPLSGYSESRQYYTYGFRSRSLAYVETPYYRYSRVLGYQPGFVVSYPIPDVASRDGALSSAESRAINKCYEKLNKYNVHVGNIIAERHQTMKLIADLVRALAHPKSFLSDVVDASTRAWLKKGSFGEIQHLASDIIGNNFLAFQFGIRPLLSDIYSAGSALARILDANKADKIVVRAVSSSSSSSVSKVVKLSSGKPIYDIYNSLTTTVKVSYVLEYKITNGTLAVLQGLGLVNPMEIAWEMMPWSFVVDWLLPVGNYIQSLNSDAGLTFVTGTKTVTTTDEYTVKYIGAYPINTNTGYGDRLNMNAESKKIVISKIRTVLTTAPVKGFPKFKSPLSAYHITEFLALVAQRFR